MIQDHTKGKIEPGGVLLSAKLSVLASSHQDIMIDLQVT